MSVSFMAVGDGSLDLNNGLASRLLRAMGYRVTEETAGSMPIAEAIAGIEKAREHFRKIVFDVRIKQLRDQPVTPEEIERVSQTADDYEYLWLLKDHIDELRAAGAETLDWC